MKMTNEELKKKIENIVAMAILEAEELPFVETAEYVADTLIAAGIGDVKDLKVQVDSLEITNIALQAGYDDAEKDRLYWVNKYKEAEYRAEVAENELKLYKLAVKIWQERYSDIRCFNFNIALRQAEKELAEEGKE